MDVDIPAIPSTYDDYRQRLRAFTPEQKPQLGWKPRSGLRVPEDPADVELLRRWVRALHDAGYVQPVHGLGTTDPFEGRILSEELGRTGIPSILGNPLVASAIAQYGTDEQRETYLPNIANGKHIWTQLFSEPDAGSDLTSLKTR